MSKLLEKIASLQLPREVEIRAGEIYRKLPAQVKGTKKIAPIAHLCVSEAYKSLEIIYHPEELVEKLKVRKPNEILKEAARHGYQPIIYRYDPWHWHKSHMKELGISEEHYDDITRMEKLVLGKFPELYEENPQVISAALVLYYARINSYIYDEKEFAKSANVGISLAILKKIKVYIDEAHRL